MIKSTIACRNQSLLGFFFCFLLICISPPYIYIIHYTCTYVKLFKKSFDFSYKNAPYFYRTFLAKNMFREFVDLFPLIIAKLSTLRTGSAVNLWRPHGTTRIELVTRESYSLLCRLSYVPKWPHPESNRNPGRYPVHLPLIVCSTYGTGPDTSRRCLLSRSPGPAV